MLMKYMGIGGTINKGGTMARLADHEVFNSILNHYDELTAVIERYSYNADLLETNIKVVLMKAFQSGQRDVLESLPK